MSFGFHPEQSRVNSDDLEYFIKKNLQGNLSEMTCINRMVEKKLRENGISTSYALIGKFLMFKEEGVGVVEHADRFYFWLNSIGIPAGIRSGIVHFICEKANSIFPGIYDSECYKM